MPSAETVPASMWRGSYGVLVGRKPIGRSIGSAAGAAKAESDAVFGTYESQRSTFSTPSWSSTASWWATPFGSMICGPPSWSCDV